MSEQADPQGEIVALPPRECTSELISSACIRSLGAVCRWTYLKPSVSGSLTRSNICTDSVRATTGFLLVEAWPLRLPFWGRPVLP